MLEKQLFYHIYLAIQVYTNLMCFLVISYKILFVKFQLTMKRRSTSKMNSARKRSNSLTHHDKSIEWNQVLKDIKNVKNKLVELSSRQLTQNKSYHTPRVNKKRQFTSFSAKGQVCCCTHRKQSQKDQFTEYHLQKESNISPYSEINRSKEYQPYRSTVNRTKIDLIVKQVQELEQRNESLLKEKKYLENKLYLKDKQKRQLQQLLFDDNIKYQNNQFDFSNKLIFNNQNLKKQKRLMYAQNRGKDNYSKIRYVPIDSSCINQQTKQTHSYTQNHGYQSNITYKLKTKQFQATQNQEKVSLQRPVVNQFVQFQNRQVTQNFNYTSNNSSKGSEKNSLGQIVEQFDIEDNNNKTNMSTQKLIFEGQRPTKLSEAETEKYILGCKKAKSPINSSNTTIFNMEGLSSIFQNDHIDQQSSRNFPFNLKQLDQQQNKARFSPRITFSRDGDLKGFSGMMRTPKNSKDNNKTPPMTKKKIQNNSQNRSLQLSVEIKGIKQTAERQKLRMMQKYFERLVGFSRDEKNSDKRLLIRQQMSQVAKQMSILRDKFEQSQNCSRACQGFIAIQQQQSTK